MNKKDNNTRDMDVFKKICDLVITMVYDNRFPVEVREEYRQMINKDMKIIALVSLDLMEELSRKN
ncbi:hypothetical protein [Clostridium algidicarnis]|uniref:hypothetical protein n=1 Tax=Clostridium algidicarnis TaxID=37659 RepID=UPI003FD7A08F